MNQADEKRRSASAKLMMFENRLLHLSVKLPSAVEPQGQNPKMAMMNVVGQSDDQRMITMLMSANTKANTVLLQILTIPRQQVREVQIATKPAYLGVSLAA